MKEVIKVAGNEVVLKGEVMFSQLKEAKGFDGDEKKKFFSITVKIPTANADEVITSVDNMEAGHFSEATKDLSVAQKKTVGKALPKYKFVADAAGEPTGEIKLELKRPEKFGAPVIRKLGEDQPVDRAFIRRGSTVLVRATTRQYKMGSMYGTGYTLQDILILEEVSMSVAPKKSSDLDKVMAAVNEEDLPF